MAVPVIAAILFVYVHYNTFARELYLLKLKETKGIKRLIANYASRNKAISKYHKINEINVIFHASNKI